MQKERTDWNEAQTKAWDAINAAVAKAGVLVTETETERMKRSIEDGREEDWDTIAEIAVMEVFLVHHWEGETLVLANPEID
jgi:hypothetical protein